MLDENPSLPAGLNYPQAQAPAPAGPSPMIGPQQIFLIAGGLNSKYILFIGNHMPLLRITPVTDTTPPDGAGCPKGEVVHCLHAEANLRISIIIAKNDLERHARRRREV